MRFRLRSPHSQSETCRTTGRPRNHSFILSLESGLARPSGASGSCFACAAGASAPGAGATAATGAVAPVSTSNDSINGRTISTAPPAAAE